MDGRSRPDFGAEAPRSISIVVACFNHARYLPLAFESIVRQTRCPDEAIFVDDASPDDSAAVLRELMAKLPANRSGSFSLLVNDRNLGQAATLNRAISAASSDLIMILNDDDYLMHDAVEAMLGLFGKHRGVAMIGATSVHFAGDDVLVDMEKSSMAYAAPSLPLTVHRPEDVPHYRGYNDLNMTHSGSCFFKVAWQIVGGYRPSPQRCVPFSDRDFQLRVNALWPVAVAYETPYSFWRTDSSVDRYANS
jgi:glycosyltransferase involved in cell wall biosynthesis